MNPTHCSLIALVLALACTQARAFSLLGPHADWMTETNGYREDGGIGGPMALDEEYRWNVPIVTYGFDDAFVQYFGKKGVRAVEMAIQTLNAVPRSSNVSLDSFALDVRRMNAQAASAGLFDLKSATLFCLLEQMGLAAPSSHIFTLRRWDPYFGQHADEAQWDNSVYENLILLRNFDPETRGASRTVNGVLYTGVVYWNVWMGELFADAGELRANPIGDASPVADGKLSPGLFFTGLSRDDAGGLRYLLSRTNVNVEALPPGARLRRSGPAIAPREGVEKIRFVRHKKRGSRFVAQTFSYPTFLVTNGVRRQQLTIRRVTRPDVLFSVADNIATNGWASVIERSQTGAWLNCADTNGNTGGAGPGIINGPVKITFNRMGPRLQTADSPQFGFPQFDVLRWGTFTQAPNAPVTYPAATKRGQLSVYVRTYAPSEPGASSYVPAQDAWLKTNMLRGAVATLQISTNQLDWTSVHTVTNTGATVEWHHYFSQAAFGVIPTTNNVPVIGPTNLPSFRIIRGSI
ncbi:MAG TPA: hypothetical protein VEH04_18690 [Verrucomicrobiae bacterium]|nr:hypothetical protein [Verrucomicrobiae bacterium]